jgi:hypothetical protein
MRVVVSLDVQRVRDLDEGKGFSYRKRVLSYSSRRVRKLGGG